VRSYAAELGYNSAGNKSRSGDGATPEGRYRITSKKPVGQSTYHMALLLDYPNAADRRRFERERRAGRIGRNVSPGGLIEVHGEGGRGKDWTKGCVALTNSEMEDLFARVDIGTPVTIVGGDGNGGTFTHLVDMHRNGASTGLD
jgi:murein L,D-transpeptidase YafK